MKKKGWSKLYVRLNLLNEAFDKRMNDELHRFDLKIVNEIDQKVLEQQETMLQAGVYGFYKTDKPVEIKLQMFLLKFIQILSRTKMPF